MRMLRIHLILLEVWDQCVVIGAGLLVLPLAAGGLLISLVGIR